MSRDSVPTPFKVHVHPYPTRFHGGQWVRPVFGLPYVHSVQSHLRPVTFADRDGNKQTLLAGIGDDTTVVVEAEGVPVIADAPAPDGTEASPVPGAKLGPRPDAPWGGNNGLFRTHGDGGGIFNRALAGDGTTGTLLAFAVGAGIGYGIHWFLTKK
jgi:hypothetical protein